MDIHIKEKKTRGVLLGFVLEVKGRRACGNLIINVHRK